MPCYPLIDKKGKSQGHLCGENLAIEMCPTCGAGMVKFLCDFPVGDHATCDRKLCLKCASEIKDGQDIHLCPEHIIYFKENSDSLYLHRQIAERYKQNTRKQLYMLPKR